jgi:pimeloyl-ACP methyl ester carboxylesterase
VPHLDLDGGFRLYHEAHGEGTAVLFAHGAGGNGLSWWQQVPPFRERYRAITFDHRAFGRSPDIEGGPGRRAFAEDTRALLDHLGVERLHFIAHSMGGRTAIGLLRLMPERFASIVFSGTAGGCVDDRYRARKAELEAEGVLAGSLLQRALAEDYAKRQPERAFLYRQVRAVNPPRPRDFLAPDARLRNYRGSTAQRLIESELPLLWIVGEHDRVVAPELIRISHELTPGSRFVEVPGAGHSAYFERPNAWNEAVLIFIDEVESGGFARSDAGAAG